MRFASPGRRPPSARRRPESWDLKISRGVDDLRRAGVLLDGARPGTMFVSEAAWIAYRDARPTRALRALLVIVVIACALGIYAVFSKTNSP